MRKISEVSRMAGVSRRTLQYYDEEGLLPVRRSKDNYRLYDDASLKRVWEILIYRAMDLEISNICRILSMTEEERQLFLDERLEEVNGQMEYLQEQMRYIRKIKEEGIPPLPSEQSGKDMTYVEQIESIRRSG